MELRRKIRFPLKLKLEVVNPKAQAFKETIDISSSGVRFQSEENMPVGHRIEYLVTLMDQKSQVKIRCNGSVVRTRTKNSHFEIAATVDRHETVREPTVARQ